MCHFIIGINHMIRIIIIIYKQSVFMPPVLTSNIKYNNTFII